MINNLTYNVFPLLQRGDDPAPPPGSVTAGEEREIALVLETGTETDAEVAHGPLTRDVQGELSYWCLFVVECVYFGFSHTLNLAKINV